MEIEIGEYVRTYGGYIYKSLGEQQYLDNTGETVDFIEDILKHSKNIIDLVEVGDVIRYKIKNISTTLETKGFIEGIVDISDKEQLENIKKDKNYEIKSILTKEQFKIAEYKIEKGVE